MFADSISHQSMTDNMEKTKMKPIARVRLSGRRGEDGEEGGKGKRRDYLGRRTERWSRGLHM